MNGLVIWTANNNKDVKCSECFKSETVNNGKERFCYQYMCNVGENQTCEIPVTWE